MNKPILKLNFTDFWSGFNKENNFITDILSKDYNIIITEKPDFLIHSVYTKEYLKYNCIRICFTGENTRPDYNKSDFHIGFDYTDDKRYLRWPLAIIMVPPQYLIKNIDIEKTFKEKTKFANFIVSNEAESDRIDFFKKLNKYKKVDSGGKVLNNIGGRVENKLEFIKNCKFTIAFENGSYSGYTTEKLTEPMMQNSIPIYYGNPDVVKDFNPKSFINVHDFKDFEEAIEYVKKVDNDDKLYKQIISEPYYYNNKIPYQFEYNHLSEFLNYIISQKETIKPVAKKYHKLIYYSHKINNKMIKRILNKVKFIKHILVKK